MHLHEVDVDEEGLSDFEAVSRNSSPPSRHSCRGRNADDACFPSITGVSTYSPLTLNSYAASAPLGGQRAFVTLLNMARSLRHVGNHFSSHRCMR